MRLPQAGWNCSGVTLGRENWLKKLDVSYLVFPERKMAKSSNSYTTERPTGDHMLARALGLGLMFPAPMKAESPHCEDSKANRAAQSTVIRGWCTKQVTRNVL